MTVEELQRCLIQLQLSPAHLATLLGLTPAAVDHWINGRRKIPMPMARIIRILLKYPGLLQEYGK